MNKKGQGVDFWGPHIELMLGRGESCRQYGEGHGLSIHALQWWRRQLKGPMVKKPLASKPSGSGTFVALRVHRTKPVDSSLSSLPVNVPTTRLNLGGGTSLEFPGLPSAPWLAQFARSLREAG